MLIYVDNFKDYANLIFQPKKTKYQMLFNMFFGCIINTLYRLQFIYNHQLKKFAKKYSPLRGIFLINHFNQRKEKEEK